MKKTALCAAILALVLVSCVPEETGQKLAVQTFENVRIPMADGVELSANISRPKAEGKFPVVLVRTPYGKGNAEDDDGRYFARRGYAFVRRQYRHGGRVLSWIYPVDCRT